MTKPLPNEVLLRHSLWQWIRFIDKMRADRYAFLEPDREFSKLEDLLEIKTGMPESDRNSIFYRTLLNDFNIWARNKSFAGRPQPIPIYPHEGSTLSERFPDLHGQKEIPQYNPQTHQLLSLMVYKQTWGRIIRQIYELMPGVNGLCYPASGYCNTYGKLCSVHDKATPIGEWREFKENHYSLFGCWQNVDYYGKDIGYKASMTWTSRLKVENFIPPFDLPYRIIIAGYVLDAYQFNGMGIVEFPGAINVLFDTGPIQGPYTSPLIGSDEVCISPDVDDIANNHSTKYNHAGWQVFSCWLIVIPAEGQFPEYCELPEEEQQ